MRIAAVVATLAVVLAASACEVDVDVAVDVNDGGDGTVTVAVGVDDDVLDGLGDLEEAIDVEDLAERGWRVDPPERRADGLIWIRATRPFGSTSEGNAALRDISGADGPFGTLRLAQDRDLVTTRYEFGGTVDLERGVEAFGGGDIGWTVEELEAAAGRPLDEVLDFRVAVDLPGEVESNAPVPDPDEAVWQPRLGERVAIVATGERFNRSTLLWAAVALAAVLALVVLLTVRTVRSSRGSP